MFQLGQASRTIPVYKRATEIKKTCGHYHADGNSLVTMGCCFAACRNCNSSQSFGHVLPDHNRGGMLVPLPTAVLKDVKVFSLYDASQLAGYDPVVRFLSPSCW